MFKKINLGVMMFLQYAIWGCWSPVLSEYMKTDLGFTGFQASFIYSLLPLATIISPFVGGQLTDRYFSAQKVIGFLQLVGGALLLYISRVTEYSSMMWLMLLYCLLYAPTLSLTNSVAFINLDNTEKDFGPIRTGGTLGWIAAGLALSGWRIMAESGSLPSIPGDTLLLAGIFSLIMGVHSFFLPDTPPQKGDNKSPWAFVEAFSMFKDKNFAIFMIISFVVSTELMFYYILTAPFLIEKVGVPGSAVSGVMVIAQVAEIFVMAILLPITLPKVGIRKTMSIGVIAWPIRYIIFTIGSPGWLVVASLALHGFCYVFFFTVAFIYVDTIAPKDIRNSAQSLVTVVILGVGNYLGSLFAGWIWDMFKVGDTTNWPGVFMVPVALTVICALAFLFLFKDKTAQSQ